MTALAVDPGWRAFAVDGGVELTAGADLAYLLPDLPAADAAFLVTLFGPTGNEPNERLVPDRVPDSVRQLIPRLRALGALRPTGLPNPPDLSVCLSVLGAEPPALRATLANTMSIVDIDPDLVLVVRTTSTVLRVLIGTLNVLIRAHRPGPCPKNAFRGAAPRGCGAGTAKRA
jgi:hypothetical protein